MYVWMQNNSSPADGKEQCDGQAVEFFAENGYAVVHGALSLAEVAVINDGINADKAADPEHWDPGPRPKGMWR